MVYADLWEYVFLLRFSSDFLVGTKCKAIFVVASVPNSAA